MIVCLCKGVSCSVVKRAIREGAGTVDEIARACGAGSDCGGCTAKIEDLLEESGPVACQHRSLPVIRAA